MPRYIKTLYIVETQEQAEAFNAEQQFATDIYVREYAIPYGAETTGLRYENVIIEYTGVRNSRYESEVAKGLRDDIHRGFSD